MLLAGAGIMFCAIVRYFLAHGCGMQPPQFSSGDSPEGSSAAEGPRGRAWLLSPPPSSACSPTSFNTSWRVSRTSSSLPLSNASTVRLWRQVAADRVLFASLSSLCAPIKRVGRSSLIEGRLVGWSSALLRSGQSRGRTMNHSTNSAHRFSSSKRNVHRFQKKSPFV